MFDLESKCSQLRYISLYCILSKMSYERSIHKTHTVRGTVARRLGIWGKALPKILLNVRCYCAAITIFLNNFLRLMKIEQYTILV